MASKFALVIANTKYTDSRLARLKAPGKDAEEFRRVLASPQICAFDDVTILVDQNASIASEAIEAFFSPRKRDDLLVLYFSGHGVRDDYGSLYLAVKNTNTERLRSTAIRSDFIRETMDHSTSRRQILILDCCYSGAFSRGMKAEKGGSIGTAKAFEGRGFGRVVLTATDSTQYAWEGDKIIDKQITNSLFTHFLIKGLEGEADYDQDGKITVDELYDYVYEQVIQRTPKQTPGKWSYGQQGNIFLRDNLKPRTVDQVFIPHVLQNDPVVPEIQYKNGFREYISLLMKRLQEWRLLPGAREEKFGLPKLEKSHLFVLISISVGLILLFGVGSLIVRRLPLLERTPTATVTLTPSATSTPSRTITPQLTQTSSPTSTRTRTATPTQTLTSTPTPTRTRVPPTQTKRKGNNDPTSIPPP
jgi:hypothetical protein